MLSKRRSSGSKIPTRRLTRTNLELEQFAYTASRDLQEPLRFIRRMASLVSKRYQNALDYEARLYLATIEESTDRISNLIRDLLGIFLSFQRLNSQETQISGVGLAVSKKIVERYGRRIWVASQPGRRSLFFFTLPMD